MSVSFAQDKPALIPQSKIAELRKDLAEGGRGTSSVELRRACKNVIRGAQALLEASADAPNRFDLVAIIFEGQKRLLSLEATEQNRKALYDTCTSLLEAPDGYAGPRFEADMILSEKKLAANEATVAERAEALKAMLAKYRGTPAEWKSLVIGSVIATKLLEFDLDKEINDTMAERFGGDHKVIEFRRNQNIGAEVEAIFSGRYKTGDGKTIVFPDDSMGQQYLVYFWSEKTPDIEEHLAKIKEVQLQNPALSEVYSFNLDELPDAGEKKLRSMGLNWTALHLPGGRDSSAYRAYVRRDPDFLFVNTQGYVLMVYIPANMGGDTVSGIHQGVLGGWNLPGLVDRADDERYLQQLQYLFTGDFLVGDADGLERVPPGKETDGSAIHEALQEIQSCFVQPPYRYRLTEKEALKNYQRAEKLSASALRKYSNSPDLWILRNRRIIALLGMWRLECESKYLDEAVNEANTVLAMTRPAGADVVARFCLATAALRDDGADPEKILADLVARSGGEHAPASALAAAAIISVEANAETANKKYREKFLDMADKIDPGLWPVCAFLRDSHHRYRNFHASPGGGGYGRPQKYAFRNMVSALGDPIYRGSLETVKLGKPDGGKITLPNDYAGEMLGVVFVEPASSVSSASNLVRLARGFAGTFQSYGVKAVTAFLSNDTNLVSSLVKSGDLDTPVGMLAGGLSNPLVTKLGILSADRVPNVMLLRPDGTIAWFISGIQYKYFGSRDLGYPIDRGIEKNIEKVRCDKGFAALEKGDFKNAIKLFDEFKPANPQSDYWASDRHQGRALAYMGLKDWGAALTEIDEAIDRRKDDFKSAMCKCHGIVEMLLTKATILEKLHRDREADIARQDAREENLPHSKLPPGLARQGVPVGVYYGWLKELRLKYFSDSEE